MRTIRDAAPDVVCLQEVSEIQLEDLSCELSGFRLIPGEPTGRSSFPRWIAGFTFAIGLLWLALVLQRWSGGAESRPRDVLVPLLETIALLALALLFSIRWFLGDFLDRGERCPLLVDPRFEPIATGTIHLGSREGVVAAGTPHVLHWARLRDDFGREILVCNTHLGFLSRERRSVARALATLERDLEPGSSVILVGDFNDLPGSALLRDLLAARDSSLRFHDAWTEAKRRSEIARTIAWGKKASGPRIDYVLVRPRLEVASAEVLLPRKGQRSPSDHYPLMVTLGLASRDELAPREQ
jgi:endonuclease/exonuclease/phosphatase family metal-dependent hydrolase